MPCENCESNNRSYQMPSGACTRDCTSTQDAKCVVYTGPTLTCLEIDSNIDLQTIIQAIDAVVCENQNIPWASFDYACLTDDEYVINSAQTFVERISELHCELRGEFDEFVETTYTEAVGALQAQIDGIKAPELTVGCAGITSADSLNTVLSKLGTTLCSINTAINPSGASWDQCYVVETPPSTLTAAFDLVIDWICALKSEVEGLSVTLPTFDNTNTCLDGTNADSLYDTVVAIRDLVCEAPEFNAGDLTFGGVESADNLEDTVQNIITALSGLMQGVILEVDAEQFALTPINIEDSYAGYKLSLSETLTATDRYVAATAEDNSPGTLEDKLYPGSNINISYTENAGKATISVTGVTDEKVKASETDDTPGFLISKINHKTDANDILSFSQVFNAGTKKVDVTPVLNVTNLWEFLLEGLQSNPAIQSLWCQATNSFECPSTTTSTTTEALSVRIEAVSENMTSSDISAEITVAQISPSAAWYSANLTVADGDYVHTGFYPVTTAARPAEGQVTLTNKESSDTIYYHIYVVDETNTIVDDATNVMGSLAPSATYNNVTFDFGSVFPCVLKIDLGNTTFSPITTTTSTSSTTTTSTSSTTTTTTTAPLRAVEIDMQTLDANIEVTDIKIGGVTLVLSSGSYPLTTTETAGGQTTDTASTSIEIFYENADGNTITITDSDLVNHVYNIVTDSAASHEFTGVKIQGTITIVVSET